MGNSTGDTWSAWLQEQRFSGGEREARLTAELREIRETILNHADLQPDDTVLDVGAGDGFVGFGALERLGPNGKVIFSDISEPLLEDCRSLAADLNVTDRCEFVVADAEELGGIDDESVDTVTIRSVLIYVEAKKSAFSQFERVLRPGGRLSVFEPIHDWIGAMQGPETTCMGYDIERTDIDVEPVPELAEKVREHQHRRRSSSSETAAMGFDERDLFSFAEAAGFDDLHLDLSARNVRFCETEDWDDWLAQSFAPGVPTKEAALEAALPPSERERFIDNVRPLVESRAPRDGRSGTAHLWATKPER